MRAREMYTCIDWQITQPPHAWHDRCNAQAALLSGLQICHGTDGGIAGCSDGHDVDSHLTSPTSQTITSLFTTPPAAPSPTLLLCCVTELELT